MKFKLEREAAYVYRTSVKNISFFGTWAFVILAVLFLWVTEQYTFLMKYVPAVGLFVIVEYVVKTFYKNKRPDFKTNKPQSSYEDFEQHASFPSGHTGKIALFTALLHLQYGVALLTTLFTGITLLAAWSRIELNRHHTKDVIGGLILGILVALIFI